MRALNLCLFALFILGVLTQVRGGLASKLVDSEHEEVLEDNDNDDTIQNDLDLVSDGKDYIFDQIIAKLSLLNEASEISSDDELENRRRKKGKKHGPPNYCKELSKNIDALKVSLVKGTEVILNATIDSAEVVSDASKCALEPAYEQFRCLLDTFNKFNKDVATVIPAASKLLAKTGPIIRATATNFVKCYQVHKKSWSDLQKVFTLYLSKQDTY